MRSRFENILYIGNTGSLPGDLRHALKQDMGVGGLLLICACNFHVLRNFRLGEANWHASRVPKIKALQKNLAEVQEARVEKRS